MYQILSGDVSNYFEIDSGIAPVMLPVIIPPVPEIKPETPGEPPLQILPKIKESKPNYLLYLCLFILGLILAKDQKKMGLSGTYKKRRGLIGFEGITCVNTSSMKISPPSVVKPKTTRERRLRLEKFGKSAFLLPGGTPARGDVPSFPITDRAGCFHCGLARMAYTRIGGALARSTSSEYDRQLKAARVKLIKKALSFADRSDKKNQCNWSYKASKRYNV